jgi:hypothetical protein
MGGGFIPMEREAVVCCAGFRGRRGWAARWHGMRQDEISEEHLLRWHSCMHKEFNLMILSGSYKYSIIG